MIGETLSHYKILEKLGEGGMGEVYLAEDTKLKRKVALKVLPPEMSSDENRLERFQREAEAVAAMDHPNIVTIFSVEEADGHHFLTMNYIEGKSLGDVIPEGGMELDQLFEMAVPLADALSAAHEKGITHRDLKPANVMVTNDGRVQVLDFGLAKLQEDGTPAGDDEPTRALTREGLVVGTVPYMSPEQVEGKSIDHRTDIFSLGVLLYEMATGDRPFQGENSAQVVSSILRDDPPSVAERKAELPFHLSRIVRHCLEKDPKKRYQSALDLKNELEGLRDEVASGHMRPASSSTVMAAQPLPKERPKWLIPAAIAGGALVLVAVLWMLLGRGDDAARQGPGEAATSPSSVAAGEPTLAVLYFDNLTGDQELDWLHTGLTDMLVTDLSQISGLKVVSTDQVYQILKDLDMLEEPITSADAVQKVAEKAAAGTVLLGSFAKAGETLRINVKVQDATSGDIVSTERVEGPAGDNIFNMVDELSTKIRDQFQVAEAPGAGADEPLMNVTTDSIEAYRYYAEGVHLENQNRSEEAIAQLEKAVEADPTFAMAFRKLGTVLSNEDRDAEARHNFQRAVEHSERLPDQEKYLVQASFYLGRPGTYMQGIEAYEKLLEIDPSNFTALNNLAIQYGNIDREEEAISLLERAAGLGDAFQGLYLNLTTQYGSLGRVDEARGAVDRLRSRHPESPVVKLSDALLELIYGDSATALELLEEYDQMRPGSFPAANNRVTALILLEDWEGARAYAQQMADSGISVRRRQGLTGLARVDLYMGKSGAAVALGDQLLSEYPDPGVERAEIKTGYAYTLGNIGRADAAETLFREAIEEAADEWVELDALWGLAWVQALQGDQTGARATAQELRAKTRVIEAEWPLRDYHHLQGLIALADEDFTTAISELEKALELLRPTSMWNNDATGIRFALAEANLGSGEVDRATEKLEWIIQAEQKRVFRPIVYVRTSYLLGQLALERGDIEQSRAYYQRFLDYWADGDLDRDHVAQAKRVVASS